MCDACDLPELEVVKKTYVVALVVLASPEEIHLEQVKAENEFLAVKEHSLVDDYAWAYIREKDCVTLENIKNTMVDYGLDINVLEIK
jgi:hypothetical protein